MLPFIHPDKLVALNKIVANRPTKRSPKRAVKAKSKPYIKSSKQQERTENLVETLAYKLHEQKFNEHINRLGRRP